MLRALGELRGGPAGPMSRRDWLKIGAGGAAWSLARGPAVAGTDAADPDKVRSIEHLGKFIHECSLPGERRSDWVAPAHPNGAQLSRRRFLILISTLGFRGVDDNLSILYQIRDGGYDGPVVKEGMLAQSIDDWDPLGDGGRYVRQFGHPVVFGVPRGALIEGRTPPHANRFVVKWRVVARTLVREGGYLLWKSEPPELRARTQGVQWMQFRLNEAEDDIEILQPAQNLRQKGFETGRAFCQRDVEWMNQSYVQAVPLDRQCTDWADVNHFDGDRIAALRYRFEPATGLYEWVQTGELIGDGVFEASLVPWGNDWVIAARRREGPGVAWGRTSDLFGRPPTMIVPDDVRTLRCPLTAYRCADGVVRLFTGDPTAGTDPRHHNRNPLFCWDIDPDRGFRASRRRKILDSFEAGIKITRDQNPIVDLCKLLPHAGGRSQVLLHRVRTCAMRVPQPDYSARARLLTADDFDATAIYHARIHYAEDLPGAWAFA